MNWAVFEVVLAAFLAPAMLLWVGALVHDLVQVLLRRRA